MLTVPLAPWLTTEQVRELPSTSVQLRPKGALMVSSSVVTEVPAQVGGSLTGLMVTLPVASALSSEPSFALYMKLSAPFWLAFGLYVAEPQLVMLAVPLAPWL